MSRIMASLRNAFKRRVSYEPLDDVVDPTTAPRRDGRVRFSWTVYFIFLLLGIAMLWAWNMFIAAGPYFQRRFRSDKAILSNFQAAELSVSTVTNLGSAFILTKLQANASYPKRIVASLIINTITFAVLALSTRLFLDVAPAGYLGLLMVTTFATSLATGFMQNGCFAFVAGYGVPEYMQAIMLGQAVAGVLPPIVQIVTVLSAQTSHDGTQSGESAFAYFLTAACVSVLTVIAFFYLEGVHPPRPTTELSGDHIPEYTDEEAAETPHDPTSPLDAATGTAAPTDTSTTTPGRDSKKSIPLLYLARQLLYPWTATFITFAVTMVFPVFTQMITTTNPHPPPLLRDPVFIPLAVLLWNAGDLIGRLTPLSRRLSLAHRPKLMLGLALARTVFIPLYLLCNIHLPGAKASQFGHAARARSLPDAVYLALVQLPFGLSNGYIGSCCMMGAGDLVREEEREAAGGFMGLVIVGGLAVGSFCSFFVGNG